MGSSVVGPMSVVRFSPVGSVFVVRLSVVGSSVRGQTD